MIVEIKINNQSLDLLGDETIVQTFSIINIENITSRTSDYSNEIRLPRTNKNLTIIDSSQFIISNTPFPYIKSKCDIYVNGFIFKSGFFELIEIDETINGRFYSGNANYYEIIKNAKLTDLRLASLDHVWDLATVFASRLNTTGYLYPMINYNQDTLIPATTWDARRMAAAYFVPTIIEAMCIENGYRFVNEIAPNDLLEINHAIVPLAKEKPTLPSSVTDANQYSGEDLNNAYFTDNYFRGNITQQISFQNNSSTNVLLVNDNPFNPGSIYNPATGVITITVSGIYKFTYDALMSVDVIEQWTSTPPYSNGIFYTLYVEVNGIPTLQIISKYFGANTNPYSDTTSASGNQNYYLPAGAQVRLAWNYTEFVSVGTFSGTLSLWSYIQTTFFRSDGAQTLLFSVELQPTVTFGQNVVAAYFLPEISQAEFLKDCCIRWGLVPIIDEDNKEVKLISFSSIKNNLPIANDWSDILDETEKTNLSFSIGNYGQLNAIKHKRDDSVLEFILGANYILTINNENLKRNVTIYESPFAQSLDGLRGIIPCIGINLFNDSTSDFSLKVEPRIFNTNSSVVITLITWTDGTSSLTSHVVAYTWFISNTENYNMGFENNLIPRYSSDIVAVLQSLKIVKQRFRLKLNHILNLRYDVPVYISQFNSYFIISEIKEFDYTASKSTDVTLIKLN